MSCIDTGAFAWARVRHGVELARIRLRQAHHDRAADVEERSNLTSQQQQEPEVPKYRNLFARGGVICYQRRIELSTKTADLRGRRIDCSTRPHGPHHAPVPKRALEEYRRPQTTPALDRSHPRRPPRPGGKSPAPGSADSRRPAPLLYAHPPAGLARSDLPARSQLRGCKRRHLTPAHSCPGHRCHARNLLPCDPGGRRHPRPLGTVQVRGTGSVGTAIPRCQRAGAGAYEQMRRLYGADFDPELAREAFRTGVGFLRWAEEQGRLLADRSAG